MQDHINVNITSPYGHSYTKVYLILIMSDTIWMCMNKQWYLQAAAKKSALSDCSVDFGRQEYSIQHKKLERVNKVKCKIFASV